MNPNYLELFQSGGTILVFIGFQVWLAKYLLGVINKKDETIMQMVTSFSTTIETALQSVRMEVSKNTDVLRKIGEDLSDVVSTCQLLEKQNYNNQAERK